MVEPKEFRELIVRPVLEALAMWSPAAENLLMGTALQESGLERLRQRRGPALGFYQMEPATHDDIWQNYLARRTDLARRMAPFGRRLTPEHLVTRLDYATALARIHYWRVPEPLPSADDAEALAAYWKVHWNTPAGVGTISRFVRNYRRFLQ